MVIPCGKWSWKSLSFPGKKCFTCHSARSCGQVASMVTCIFSLTFRCRQHCHERLPCGRCNTNWSDIQWHSLGHRKPMRLTTERFSSSRTVWHRSPAVQGNTKSRVLSDWVQEIDSVWHWARFGMHKYFSWLMLDQNVVSMLYIHAELPNNWYYLGRGKQHAQACSGRNSCQELLKDKALWVAEGKGLRLHRCGLQLLHGW